MSTEVKFEHGNLIVTRVYEAPRELVFEAWVETSKVQQWWGCAECTSVRSEIEPEVGGAYNHHMTIEGAGEVPGFATLIEYDPPARLAYAAPDPGAPGDPSGPGDGMTVSVDFLEVDGGTRVRLVHAGIPDLRVDGDVELREIVRAGWTAALGKLGKLLEAETHRS